jgi:predicted transcriptional regulator
MDFSCRPEFPARVSLAERSESAARGRTKSMNPTAHRSKSNFHPIHPLTMQLLDLALAFRGLICRLSCVQSTTIRVRAETHKTLARLAKESHSSLQSVLIEALEAYRRKVFLQRTNQAYAELRSDPAAWARYEKELAAWDGTSEDGL